MKIEADPGLPLAEEYRLVGKRWVDAEAAANLLEQTKSAVLARHMSANIFAGMPLNKAEMQVKASEQWTDFIANMVEARKDASLLKVELEYIHMKFMEAQSAAASRRAEMKL